MISNLQVFAGSRPHIKKFMAISNRQHFKPHGGLWTCDYLGAPDYSAWTRWCVDQNFRGPDFDLWLLQPLANNVLVIDDVNVWQKLPHSPLIKEELPTLSFIDFEGLAERYDGLCLTDEFIYAYRNDLMVRYGLTINSWDVPSTVWFRWCFESVEYGGHVTVV